MSDDFDGVGELIEGLIELGSSAVEAIAPLVSDVVEKVADIFSSSDTNTPSLDVSSDSPEIGNALGGILKGSQNSTLQSDTVTPENDPLIQDLERSANEREAAAART